MKRQLLILIVLFVHSVFSQEMYDQCNNALHLCPQEFERVNNFNASRTQCPSCEDDFTDCFSPNNTIWLSFNTNDDGGEATITATNISFDATLNNDNNSLNLMVLEAVIPCDAASYTEIACITEQNNLFSLNVLNLNANSTYFMVLSGTQVGPGAIEPSEFELDIRVAGEAVNRPPAAISMGASNTVLCTNEFVQIGIDTTFCPGGNEVNWYKNGEFWFTSAAHFIVVDDIEDDDQISAQTICFEDCPVEVSSGTIQFTVLHFDVDAGFDQELFAGESIQLQGSTTGVNYFWEPELWLSDPEVLDPIAFPEQTTTFFLTATNGVCERTDEVTITVINGLQIPSVFSPNGDGINDKWEIKGTSRYPDMRVDVFDRWGQKVFESVSYNEEKFWDGTHRGNLLRTSTYYYVITLNDPAADENVLKGAVSIVR